MSPGGVLAENDAGEFEEDYSRDGTPLETDHATGGNDGGATGTGNNQGAPSLPTAPELTENETDKSDPEGEEENKEEGLQAAQVTLCDTGETPWREEMRQEDQRRYINADADADV